MECRCGRPLFDAQRRCDVCAESETRWQQSSSAWAARRGDTPVSPSVRRFLEKRERGFGDETVKDGDY